MFESRFNLNFKGCSRPVFKRRILPYSYMKDHEHTKIIQELRKDFEGKCGYCGWPDNLSIDSASFHIDHFNPNIKNITGMDNYKEYIYSCPLCNTTKKNQVLKLDPTEEVYNSIYYRNFQGSILIKEGLDSESHTIALEVHKTLGLSKEIHKIEFMIIMMNDIKEYIRQNYKLLIKYAEVYVKIDEILCKLNNIYTRKTYYIR